MVRPVMNYFDCGGNLRDPSGRILVRGTLPSPQSPLDKIKPPEPNDLMREIEKIYYGNGATAENFVNCGKAKNLVLHKWPKWMGEFPRGNVPWSQPEDDKVLSAHRAGIALKDIAYRHGRRIGAIDYRLVKLLPDYYSIKVRDFEIEAARKEVERLQEELERAARRLNILRKV